ncbi:MAG: hypothetical protein KAT05_13625, partial [Spirochaetes bacterium]|nr:hypothetical protein [Spirochaetota bacterium]
MNQNLQTTETKTTRTTKFFIILGCFLPLIPILLFISYYRMPKEYAPYYIDLTGTWKIHEGTNQVWKEVDVDDKDWKKIKIPGQYYMQGFRDKHCWMRRNFVLTDDLVGENLFFIIGGTCGSIGRVYINGNHVGEIGIYEDNKKFGDLMGLDNGFMIEEKYFAGRGVDNIIAIEFCHESLGMDGIQDPHFYLGVNKYLRPYYEKNKFLRTFFQYGITYFSILMIIILMILLFTEWKDGDRYKYISTILFVFSAFFYNFAVSGAFYSFYIRLAFRNNIIIISIIFICLALMEFIQYYFTQKINLFGKINRFICLTVMIAIAVIHNSVVVITIYKNFVLYFLILLLYFCFIGIRDSFFRKTKKYGLIVTSALVIGAITGISDILVNIGIINMPMVLNITISSITVIATVVVMADFINISVTNKRLTVGLRKANVELRELDRLKSEFLANTGHELRTPINGILGLAEGIIDGADGPINTKIKNHLTMVTKSANNLKNLINDILDISKIQSGKQRFNIKEININDIIEDVKPAVAGLIMNKPVKMEFNIHDEVKNVYADKGKIRQALINLIGNAVKFTDKGHVKINAKLYEQEGFVLLSVSDTGIGIKKKNLNVIFDEFRQADGSAARQYEGTGLG